jgi:lysophospholipase
MKLLSIPANPAPDGAIVGAVRTTDGVTLRYSRWPGAWDARGTIFLLQGRAEFIEKYFEVITELRSRGFSVVTFDWRGQGASEHVLPDERKGYVESFRHYDLDFDAAFEQVVMQYCDHPYIGLAHSSGGTVLLRAAASGRWVFDHIVLTCPMIGIPSIGTSRLARAALRGAVAAGLGTLYIPGGRAEIMDLRPFARNRRTSDPKRYARAAEILVAEPALGLGSPTIGWTAAAAEAVHEFADPRYPIRIRTRSLIVTSGGDQIVSTPASRAFAAKSNFISYVPITEAKHELLMERDNFRSQFWAAFDSFIT